MNRSPASQPDVPTTVEQLLASARARLNRLSPDCRPMPRRATGRSWSTFARTASGLLTGSSRAHWFVPRNVLEWRLDPAWPHRDPQLARPDVLVVLICDEG